MPSKRAKCVESVNKMLPASPPPRPVRVVAALGFGVAGDGRLLLGGVGLGQYLSNR